MIRPAKTALITGIHGQDGAYLARYLLERGYTVVGTTRTKNPNRSNNFDRLGISHMVAVKTLDLLNKDDVACCLAAVSPDEIYHLAGQSSVAQSFEFPFETIQSIAGTTLNLLESVRQSSKRPRLFCAGSGDCYGDTAGIAATETTPFHPLSPYAVARASAFWQVANYRTSYDMYACTGLLFAHISPLQGEQFVVPKIVVAACRIAGGSGEILRLGNIAIQRDWGWAPDYVEAMHMMLQQPFPDDFIIASGTTTSLTDLVAQIFSAVGLDWRDHVTSSNDLRRPTDIPVSRADISKAEAQLQWHPRHGVSDIAQQMVSEVRERMGLNAG